MNWLVRSTTEEEGHAIVGLMRDAGLHPDPDPAYLQWKYWLPTELWEGSRSFVLADGPKLFAHGAIVPGTLRSDSAEARVIHIIDWAAREQAGGGGILLMNYVARFADFLLGIGGSRHTLEILPRLGYQHCGEVRGYVRALSPVAVLRSVSRPRWRVVPRFARSVVWSVTAPGGSFADWSVRRLGVADVDQLSDVLPVAKTGISVFGRSSALFRFALSCPFVSVELYAMERSGQIGGYFMLSHVPGQVRIADLWMSSADSADWRAAIFAAVHQAKTVGGVAEVAAWSSESALSAAFEECGFHQRFTRPIFLRSVRGAPLPQGGIRVQMIDNDAYYLHSTQRELWA